MPSADMHAMTMHVPFHSRVTGHPRHQNHPQDKQNPEHP